MSNRASSLPDAWVQSLWSELAANYAGKWQRQFPVPPCPPGADPAQHAHDHIRSIQNVWAKRLGHLQSNPKALRYALDNLPENPPTLPEFIALCNRRPDAPQKALPAPEADPQRVQQVLDGMKRVPVAIDRLAPLRELHRNDIENNGHMPNGKRITAGQRHVYRKALGLDVWGGLTRDQLEPTA